MKKPGAAHPPPEVFIVSTGRCGSTLLSNMLRLHPDVLSLSEFFMTLGNQAFARREISGKRLWKMLSEARPAVRLAHNPEQSPKEFLYRFGSNARFSPDTLPPLAYITLPHMTSEPDEIFFELEPHIKARGKKPIAEQYRFLFDWLRRRLAKKLWVERSGGSLIFLPALIRNFPAAKFIHVYRDGRDVAYSVSRHPPMKLLARNWFEAKKYGVDLFKAPFRIGDSPLLSLIEPLVTPFVSIPAQLEEPWALERIGAFWSEMVVDGLAHLGTIPKSQCHHLCYESLIASPKNEIERLIRFIEPALASPEWIRKAAALAKPQAPAWRTLPRSARRRLEEACRPGMTALGYG
jgi:Sulfotransferase family